jgi:hypothetical protein
MAVADISRPRFAFVELRRGREGPISKKPPVVRDTGGFRVIEPWGLNHGRMVLGIRGTLKA